MNEGLILLIVLIAASPCLVALFTVLEVLFPRVVASTRRAAEEVAGRAFVVGLVNALFLGAVAVALFAVGEEQRNNLANVLGLLVLALLGLGVTFGLAGMVQLIGTRLVPERSERWRTILGATALILACFTPLVGWLGLLPYVGLLGLGAFIIGHFRRV
jgi:hypothetical protein